MPLMSKYNITLQSRRDASIQNIAKAWMASAREKRYGDQHITVVTDRLSVSELSDIAVDVKNRNFLENMPYDFNYISW